MPSSTPLLYDDLADWYHLVDPPEDHEAEVDDAMAVLRSAARGPLTTLLELGSGAGNNALYLKRHVACTLSDLSEPMLALSRRRNPDCPHVAGDMRTLRLGRTFDAVLVHDAIMYMTTLEDLRAAARTAWEHTRPGGTALFLPDCTKETFVAEETDLVEGDDGIRALRGVIWGWDPDPSDTIAFEEFLFLLRMNGEMRTVHDRHVFGVFAQAQWCDALASVGFDVTPTTRMSDGAPYPSFLCSRA